MTLAAASFLRVQVSAQAARRFLVARHFLAPARSLAGSEGVLEVFRRFGSIQFDPVAVAGRSHDLVLHARVAGYEPSWCEELYQRRAVFEATNKALSFVPVGEFPWFRQAMGRKGPRFHAQALAVVCRSMCGVIFLVSPARCAAALAGVHRRAWKSGYRHGLPCGVVKT